MKKHIITTFIAGVVLVLLNCASSPKIIKDEYSHVDESLTIERAAPLLTQDESEREVTSSGRGR